MVENSQDVNEAAEEEKRLGSIYDSQTSYHNGVIPIT